MSVVRTAHGSTKTNCNGEFDSFEQAGCRRRTIISSKNSKRRNAEKWWHRCTTRHSIRCPVAEAPPKSDRRSLSFLTSSPRRMRPAGCTISLRIDKCDRSNEVGCIAMFKTKPAVITFVCAVAAVSFANANGHAARTAQATSPVALTFTVKTLGHNVYAAIDDAKGDAGANAGFVIGDDGVAVIDTFEKSEASKQM